jgi:hypothetical protein
VPTEQETLIRIATLYLAIPGKKVKEYLGPARYHELLECYKRVKKSVPPQGKLFEDKINDGK